MRPQPEFLGDNSTVCRCQEMGRVVTYLEKEKGVGAVRAQEVADKGVRELKLMAKKLLLEQSKREKTEQRLQLLQTGLADGKKEEGAKIEENIRTVKMEAEKVVAEKEKVVQETTEKLNISEAQLESLLNSLKTKEAVWKTKEVVWTKQLEAAMERVEGLETAVADGREKVEAEEVKIRNLEERMKNQQGEKKSMDKILKTKNTKLEEKLKELSAQSNFDKVVLGNLEGSVKTLEEANIQAARNLANAEAQNQRLKEEKVSKARSTREAMIKLEANIKTSTDAKNAAEKKRLLANERLKELETKLSDTEVEAEEVKRKLAVLETGRSEAVSKYKEVQERMAEADMKYLEAEREGGELKKLWDEQRQEYEFVISNKSR